MPTTYPPVPATLSGDFITISRFLENPTLVARRLRTILQDRFIADVLLTGRFNVSGGAIQYETSGESIYANDAPRAIAPGAKYPLTTVGTGPSSLAKTVKWGEDSEITDESIKRQSIDPVNRTLLKLANTLVKYIDGIALSAIATSVTASAPAAAAWTTASAEQILRDVALAKANIVSLNEGYDPNIIVVDDLTYAYVWTKFLASGMLPREAGNPLGNAGVAPTLDGLTWLVSPNLPVKGTAMLVDTTQLGGMADEDLGGPGYVNSGGVGVQVKTMRLDENDAWKVRTRRVTVPVILEPRAARLITGVGDGNAVNLPEEGPT